MHSLLLVFLCSFNFGNDGSTKVEMLKFYTLHLQKYLFYIYPQCSTDNDINALHDTAWHWYDVSFWFDIYWDKCVGAVSMNASVKHRHGMILQVPSFCFIKILELKSILHTTCRAKLETLYDMVWSVQVVYLKILRGKEPKLKEVEISTVDGFQGREKEAVIISMVRSNSNREVCMMCELFIGQGHGWSLVQLCYGVPCSLLEAIVIIFFIFCFPVKENIANNILNEFTSDFFL